MITAFLAGIGLAAVLAFLFSRRPARRARAVVHPFPLGLVDLNTASAEQLTDLGLGHEIAGRIIENRPYRNKLELVSRLLLPLGTYSEIKGRVVASGAHDAVKVAS